MRWMLNIYLDFRKYLKYSSTTININFPPIYDNVVFINRPKKLHVKGNKSYHELLHWKQVCPI